MSYDLDWMIEQADYVNGPYELGLYRSALDVIKAERALADDLAAVLDLILGTNRSLSAVELGNAHRVMARYREARQQ